MENFWHVTYTLDRVDSDGNKQRQKSCLSEQDARRHARILSINGYATITNLYGLVDTYVDGVRMKRNGW